MQAGGQPAAGPAAPTMQPANNSKKIIFILLAVFGGLFLIGAICFIIFIVNIVGFAGEVIDEVSDAVKQNSSVMTCEYSGGAVTVYYDENGLKGQQTIGKVNFDYEQEKIKASRLGIDSWLDDYSERFGDKYSGGYCKHSKFFDDNDNSSKSYNWDDDEDDTSSTTSDVKVVGSDEYGYLEIPSNWYDFRDVDGTDSLQWSYGLSYIVSLYAYGDKTEGTAKEYADAYMASKLADTSVTGVTGATVTVGSSKKYTAYQVYMYYPADSTYLVTYWFEDETGNVHYIALEGPEGVEDYTSIPESFRLKK